MSRNHLINLSWLLMLLVVFFTRTAKADNAKLEEVGREEKVIAENAKALLLAGKFEELDKVAVRYHDPKKRVDGGVWKLRHLSTGLAYPRDRKNPEDWKVILEKLAECHEKSGTAFSLNALGHAQLNRAWNIRGYGYAGGVDPANWGTFAEWVEKAEKSLQAAIKMDAGCVDAYKSLLHVEISHGWKQAKMQAMFDQAVKIAPEYYDFYYNMAFYKMERWYGEAGEWQKFLNSIPSLVPGEQGLAIYTRTAMQLHRYYAADFFGEDETKVSWSRMKGGFEAILKTYPGIWNHNKFAVFALAANDLGTAEKQFLELEERGGFFPEVWSGEANIEKAREQLGLDKK